MDVSILADLEDKRQRVRRRIGSRSGTDAMAGGVISGIKVG